MGYYQLFGGHLRYLIRKGEDMLTMDQKIKCIIILAPYFVLLWMFLARLGRSEAE